MHCQSRNRGAPANAPADQVDWAGMPVNLDLAFSQNQRDKVFTQHLLRRRGTLLQRWSRDVTPICVCQIADYEHMSSDTGRSVSNL